jgi:hypothetical protein
VWLLEWGEAVQVTAKFGLAQPHGRLRWKVMRQLHQVMVKRPALEITPATCEWRWRLAGLNSGASQVASESRLRTS